MNVKTLTELAQAGELKGKRVFIRADLNVPFDDQGEITEDTRIRASVPGDTPEFPVRWYVPEKFRNYRLRSPLGRR